MFPVALVVVGFDLHYHSVAGQAVRKQNAVGFELVQSRFE